MSKRSLSCMIHRDTKGGQWLSIKKEDIEALGIAGAMLSPMTMMAGQSAYIDRTSKDYEVLKEAVYRSRDYEDTIEEFYSLKNPRYNRVRGYARYNGYDVITE